MKTDDKSTKTMYHTNVISAAMREDWTSGQYVDGDSDNPYSQFIWSIYKKSGASVDVIYDIDSETVTIRTVDVFKGKKWHHFDIRKSKKIKRLVFELSWREIPATFEECFIEK